MKKLFVVPLSQGSNVEVLFAAPQPQGPTGYATQGEIIEKAVDTLEVAFDTIRQIGLTAVERFAGLSAEAVEIKVGVGLSGKGKFIVAEASAEASLEVKFTIKPKP
jgi:Trypsin-co-occurring domain 1